MELTKEELTILINVLALSQVRLTEAPALINLSNKLSQMVADMDKPKEEVKK
jgi:hypothetical protein